MNLDQCLKYEIICLLMTFKECIQNFKIDAGDKKTFISLEKLVNKLDDIKTALVENKKEQVSSSREKMHEILLMMLSEVFPLESEIDMKKYMK